MPKQASKRPRWCRLSCRRLCAPILLLALSPLLFAQTAPPAADKTASVAGTVVNAITGEAIPRAHVALMSFHENERHDYGAMTTTEGKFSITGVRAGWISATVTRVGFVTDQSSAAGAELKAGDHKDDLTLKLTPTGAIAGTVVDADGEPVESCNVVAESSRFVLPSSTDAQGKFRIGGLTPGKYRIKATPNNPGLPPEIRTDGTVESHYSETYYPSALDDAGAARVAVQAGAESGGIEIRLVRTPIVRVSGKVSGAPAGAENVLVTVNRKRDRSRGSFIGQMGGGGGARVKKDGTFAIWRLAPGSYRIAAQWNTPNGQMAAVAPVDVVVGDANIDGVELRMMAAADVAGQVEYEDDAKPPEPATDAAAPSARPNAAHIGLQGIDGSSAGAFTQVDSNGAFTLEKVLPGRYRVIWAGGRGFVKSMRLGQSEIPGPILDLGNGAAGATLAIVVSTKYGSLSGSVQADGASTAGLKVVMMPDGPEQGYQLGDIGTDGSYSFNNVVPGAYKLAAIAGADANGVMQGGDEWDQYAPVMETVTIAAGDKATQDLKILAR